MRYPISSPRATAAAALSSSTASFAPPAPARRASGKWSEATTSMGEISTVSSARPAFWVRSRVSRARWTASRATAVRRSSSVSSPWATSTPATSSR